MKLSLYDIPWTSYIFDPILKTIEIVWLSYVLKKSNIWGIINTTSNILIYRIDKQSLGWSMSWTNKITLTYNTSSMDAWDDISIILDVPENIWLIWITNFTFTSWNLTEIEYSDWTSDTFVYDINGDLDTITKV